MTNVLKEEVDKIIKGIREDIDILLSDSEASQLYTMVQTVEKIKGDIAEVGVYKGGSARIIREASMGKNLHLFDTFEGLPSLSKEDKSLELKEGLYSYKLDDVKENLKNYKDIYYYSGVFPFTITPVRDTKFSFVHLDIDLYESTLSALEFFYPRLSLGGIILSHDYPNLRGVKKAFDEFFLYKPEVIIELRPCSQCMVIKLS